MNVQRRTGKWGRGEDILGAHAFLLPNFLGFLTFTFLPMLASLALNLANWDVFRACRVRSSSVGTDALVSMGIPEGGVTTRPRTPTSCFC